jgi:hypothetical protein
MQEFQLDLWADHRDEQFLGFEEARAIVHSLGLEYEEEWSELVASEAGLPDPGIPHDPGFIYRHTGWKGWKDWLVPPDRLVKYSPYFEAKEFVWCLRLPDELAWFEYIRSESPVHQEYNLLIPKKPWLEYKIKDWKNWNVWLGLDVQFADYEHARHFVHSLKLGSRKEWNAWCKGLLNRPVKKSKVIFRYPEIAYKDEGWKDWEDWLHG